MLGERHNQLDHENVKLVRLCHPHQAAGIYGLISPLKGAKRESHTLVLDGSNRLSVAVLALATAAGFPCSVAGLRRCPTPWRPRHRALRRHATADRSLAEDHRSTTIRTRNRCVCKLVQIGVPLLYTPYAMRSCEGYGG